MQFLATAVIVMKLPLAS